MKECSYIVRDLGYLLALLPEFSPKVKIFEEPRESNATVAKHLWGTSPIHAQAVNRRKAPRRILQTTMGIEHVDGPINIGIDRLVALPARVKALAGPPSLLPRERFEEVFLRGGPPC